MGGSTIDLSIAITAMDAASGVIKNIASNFGPVGTAAVAAAGAAIGFGVASVQAAANFQEGMTTLVTGAGEAQSNIALVSQGILGLAVSTGTSTKQLTDGMYMIESAGYHGAAGLAVLKAAAQGAKVGNADLGTVADATTTIMTDFGLKASQASVAVNTMVATVANGKTTMGALAGSLSQIMPTASAAGVSLNNTAAALATMTGEGVPAANAATYLRQTILGLEAPSAGTVKALKSVGLTSAEVSDEMKKSLPDALKMITDAVGKKFPVGSAQYVAAIKNISGGAKTMQGMLDLTGAHLATFKQNVTNISGAVKKGGDSITGWSQVQQNFNFKLSQAREVVETLMIKIGTALLPVLSQLMSAVMPLITQFSDWITKSGVLEQGISSVTGSLSGAGGIMNTVKGYVLSLVEAVGRIIGSFARWMIQGGGLKAILGIVQTVIANIYPPVSRLISVVSTVIAHFIDWGNKSGTFNGIIHGVGVTVGIVSGIVGTIIGKIADFIGWMEQGSAPAKALGIALLAVGAAIAVMKIGNMVADIIAMIPQMIAWIATTWAEFAAETSLAIAEIIANWPIYLIIAAVLLLIGIIVLLVQHWHQVIAFLQGAWQAFASWFMSALQATGQFFSNIWSAMVSFVTNIVSGVVSWLKNTWQNAVNTVVGWFSWLYNHNYYFKMLVDSIRNIINTVVTWLRTTWSTVTGWIVAKWTWLKDMATMVFMAVYVTIQAKLELVRNFITSIWTTIVTWLSGIWSKIWGQVSAAWAKISGIFASAWNTYVAPPLNTLKNSIVNFFTNLANTAISWGQGLISGFIKGIQNMAGGVGSAVQGIMKNVAGFLGFHSPSEQGPGRELNVWGPNMVKGFAQGITNSIPLLQTSLNLLMSPVARTLGTPQTTHAPVLPSGGAASAGAGSTGATIVLNVTVNARPQDESEMERIAKFTVTYMTEHIQGQFGNLYAGGR